MNKLLLILMRFLQSQTNSYFVINIDFVHWYIFYWSIGPVNKYIQISLHKMVKVQMFRMEKIPSQKINPILKEKIFMFIPGDDISLAPLDDTI